MPPIRVRLLLVFLAGVLGARVLAACSMGGPNFIAKDEPWRATEERSCLASGVVRESPFIRVRAALGGPSVCGAEQPFEMAAAGGGRVRLKPPALLRCPMIPQVDRWIATVIEPAARDTYGADLVEITVAASYGCRPMNNVPGAQLSEHGHANALDVSAFTFSDGTRITVKSGWHGDLRERAFLHAVHDGACTQFTTVLSPDYDSHHHDHFHVDLARRGPDGLRTVCK
jgi:hypothetical protein